MLITLWHQVVHYIRAIRKGPIKFDKPKEEPHVYLLWSNDSSVTESKRYGLSYIPPPKPKLAGIMFTMKKHLIFVQFTFGRLHPYSIWEWLCCSEQLYLGFVCS